VDLQLNGKIALVTGASRGLGLGSARALAAEGCHVAICARTADRLERAAADLRAIAGSGASVAAIQADVSTAEGAAHAVAETVRQLGGIDILVNNVGVAKGAGLVDTPDPVWQEAFDHTLFPAIRASRAAVPHFQTRGGGVILIVSSIFGREAGGRMTYNVVKAAEISFGKALAQQLAKDNIRVVTIAPGSILFPGGSWHTRQQADPDGIADFVKRELPFGRFGTTDEVGNVVAFLASSRASWVSGTTVVVDGCQSRMF
jgi:3-oxoacyl-[acyl-carrier protein] reductase